MGVENKGGNNKGSLMDRMAQPFRTLKAFEDRFDDGIYKGREAAETAFIMGWAALKRAEIKTGLLLNKVSANRAGDIANRPSRRRARKGAAIVGLSALAAATAFLGQGCRANDQGLRERPCEILDTNGNVVSDKGYEIFIDEERTKGICIDEDLLRGPGANLTPRNEGVDGTVSRDPELGG